MAIEGSLPVLPVGVTVTMRAPGARGRDDWAVAPTGATSSATAMIREAVTVIYRFLVWIQVWIKYTIYHTPHANVSRRHQHGLTTRIAATSTRIASRNTALVITLATAMNRVRPSPVSSAQCVLPLISPLVRRQFRMDTRPAATPTITAAHEMAISDTYNVLEPIVGIDSGTILGKHACAAIA